MMTEGGLIAELICYFTWPFREGDCGCNLQRIPLIRRLVREFLKVLNAQRSLKLTGLTISGRRPVMNIRATSFASVAKSGIEDLRKRSLLLGTSAVPIHDADQLPRILAELELKLTLLVDDELGSRIENTAALVLV